MDCQIPGGGSQFTSHEHRREQPACGVGAPRQVPWGSLAPHRALRRGAGRRGHSARLLTPLFCSFPAKKYKKVTGKEIYSDTLESTPMLEKEKFPQDYFPEVRPGGPAGPVSWVTSSAGGSRRKGTSGHVVLTPVGGPPSAAAAPRCSLSGRVRTRVVSSGLS